METVRIYRLKNLPNRVFQRLHEARRESAAVWSQCMEIHQQARQENGLWPDKIALQKATKGRFALHSQSVQMVCHAFLANVETTRQIRRTDSRMRYPYKSKHVYPLLWPKQAVVLKPGRVILPMGRGRESIVLRLELPEHAGACKIVWRDGFELHVTVPAPESATVPGEKQATVDLGEIHLAAVSTNGGEALVVSGRGIRAIKRQRSKSQGKLAKKRSRCKKGSRRWRKLKRAGRKLTARTERRIRDLRHKATRQVIDFCRENQVGKLYVGNPDGVRRQPAGRHHHQRMSLWEYGKDIAYLQQKAKQARIVCFTGTERGTSSRCPECEHRQKPKGRAWRCRKCRFEGHRDVLGSVNMHPIAYGEKIAFPHRITYRRPGFLSLRRRSSLDTGQSSLGEAAAQPPAVQGLHSETGQTAAIA